MRRLPIVALAVVTAACSVGTRAPRTPTFLTQVEPIARDVNDAIGDMRTVLGRSYEAEYIYVNAVVDVRLGERIAIGRDRLQRLEPEATVTADAEQYQALLDRLQEQATVIDAAMVLPADRAVAALAAAQLEADAARTFASLTPQACRFMTFDFSLCAEDAFFSPAERTAHDALVEAAVAIAAYASIPQSIRNVDLDAVKDTSLNEVGDALREASATISSADPNDPDFQSLASSLSELAAFTDEIADARFSPNGINDGFDQMRERICAMQGDFPPPDPVPAEGGTTVEIAGFADVWFSYAGRCGG